MRKELLLVFATVSMIPGCVRSAPKPAVTMPGSPYVSWIIMSGDSDNPDREFVCQSEPRTECVVPVSRPDDQVFSDVHVYYHGAGAETKYTGSIQIGFFKAAPVPHVLKTNVAVKKTESITNQSVSDIVTSTPGTYHVDFAIEATVTDVGRTQPIRDQVQVIVR